MHAAFPRFTKELNQVFNLGVNDPEVLSMLPEKLKGKALAEAMAVLLEVAFGLTILKDQTDQSIDFFEENFVIKDPCVERGKRYYQGKFLIRTKKPGDDMNVLLKFCPDLEKIFMQPPLKEVPNPAGVVYAEAFSENEAEHLEKDPEKVDLVIRFKDVDSILEQIKTLELNMVGLLLENLVQLTGNVGHLFKLGAIADNVVRTLKLPKL